jgi:hypothetical protein
MSNLIIRLSEKKWYYRESQSPRGPVSQFDIIEKIQRNELSDYQFIWAPHFDNWKRLCDSEEFSKIYVQSVYEQLSGNDGESCFLPRRTLRKKIICEVSGHNSNIFLSGHTESLSLNGCQAELNTPLLQTCDQVTVHFTYPKNVNLNFNALCEVLQKKYTPCKLRQNMKIKYILKFLKKNQEKSIEEILAQATDLKEKTTIIK